MNFSIEDLNKSICRLCLRFENSKKMVSLIDNTNEDGLSYYGKGVSQLSNVVINKLDPLPNNMCQNCLHLLKQAVYFKLQCEHTDKCFKNIARHHSENADIMRAVVDFAKQNFYSNYKYSFSATLEKRDTCKRSKKDCDKNNEDNLQYDTNGSMDNISVTNSHSENVGQDSIKETKSDYAPIENNANYIIVKPLQKTPISKENEIKMLDVLEKVFVPKECNIPIKKLTKMPNKLKKPVVTGLRRKTNTQCDNIIKDLEMLYGSPSKDEGGTVEPYSKDFISARRRRMKFSRNGHNDTQNEQKQDFKCNVCGKVLANPHTYKHHMERHTGCRYICEHCGKGFPVLKELHIHQVCRHGTGPGLPCSQCPFKASRTIELIEHERIHTGERPFACEKCGLTFRRRAIWRKHLVIHSEKTVQCPQCNKKFFQRGEMLSHANSVHERVYMYMCTKCDATYAKSSTVRRHMIERHGIPREAQGKIIRINKKSGNVRSNINA
ncbi:zinc finger protein interacting with ribonucleoprotein K-like [Aricia agestis]|uniref:zinc finger protein interacting with ribonucleoprotein K-like n=1 Tax=Aricia agestis TaxID=91739 RepID=UPI001C203682|nr:zinc finger protein interacting with ribonucleoprotein K-like [Aricia agestis]